MTTYPQRGRFVWHEIATPNPDQAIAYYTKLLSWGTRTVDMGPHGEYTMFTLGENALGGAIQLKEGDSPHWASYCTVDDVDQALETARSQGATVDIPGTDVPETGRFGRFTDPQGAVIYPWTWAGESPPEDPEPPVHGQFCWHELLMKDPAQARDFYAPVFGWTYKEQDMGPMGIYTLIHRGEKQESGMMPMPEGAPGPCEWLPYVAVDDVDAMAAKVPELGGAVFVPPSDIPGVGRFSVTADPQGAKIAFYKSAH